MKKIKIVNVVSKLSYGGVEAVLYNYYTNMELEPFDITIISQKSSNSDEIKKFENLGIKVVLFDNWEKEPFKVGKDIIKLFKKEKYDIIHAHLSYTNFYFLALAYISKIKIRISHSHLSQEDTNIFQKIKHNIYKVFIKIFATDYLACGDGAKKSLYGNSRKAIVIKNGIQLEKYGYNKSIRDEYRKKFNLKASTLCIGNVGRLTAQKNQLFLIEVFNELIKINQNSILMIVGNGENKSELLNLINKFKLRDKVLMLGNRNDVNCLMQMFDIFCLPSVYEGLPVVGIEAQAANVPIVFSDSVDKKVRLNTNVYFMDLKNPAEKWAKLILDVYYSNKKKDRKENNTFDTLTSNGYNITIESNKLKELYIDRYNSLNKK